MKINVISPWIWPYLFVSLAGWDVCVQLHPDLPILLIHCQDLKKIPYTRGLVSWIYVHLPDSSPTPPVLGASTVCCSMRGSTSPMGSVARRQQSHDRIAAFSGIHTRRPRSVQYELIILGPHPGCCLSPAGGEIYWWRSCFTPLVGRCSHSPHFYRSCFQLQDCSIAGWSKAGCTCRLLPEGSPADSRWCWHPMGSRHDLWPIPYLTTIDPQLSKCDMPVDTHIRTNTHTHTDTHTPAFQ